MIFSVVIYWSRAFYAREKHENQSFLDFIEKLKANPAGFRVSAAQSRSLRKYMKKETIHKETGEIVDSKKLLSMIDDDKLTEFNELMGYYQIVSSELDMDDLEIIDKYHELTRIEDQFREMKGTLETRPIWVNTSEHIQAHLMICFTITWDGYFLNQSFNCPHCSDDSRPLDTIYITIYTVIGVRDMMTAKVFENGRSQAVRLPKECRFDSDEVIVNKIGDILLLVPPGNKWVGFMESLELFTDDYMEGGREQAVQVRDEL